MSNFTGSDDTELEIRLGLMDECKQEQDNAFVKAFNEWKYNVAGFIKKHFPDFTELELKDTVSKTFIDFRRAVSKVEFNFDKPLYGILFTIALRRGYDECRRRKKIVTENCDDFIEIVYNRLNDAGVNKHWQEIVNKGAVAEVESEFRKFVSKLPPAQRKIGRVIADSLPDILTPIEIADEILSQTGEKLTSTQIKGSLQALRNKFRSIMDKRLQ